MPAKSQDQATAAAMALQAKKGQLSKGQLKGAARDMFESMSSKQLRDFAKVKPAKKTKPPGANGKKRGPGRPPKKKKGSE